MATRKVNVTKLGVGSFARICGVAYALIGLVAGLIATIAVASGQITSQSSFVHSFGVSILALGWGVLIYPLIMFVIGWIEGGIIAIVLNLVFRESRGLELELEDA